MDQSRIQALINESQSGNSNAFALLVEEFQFLVFRLAFRLLCNKDDRKDIVQETFVKVWLSFTNTIVVTLSLPGYINSQQPLLRSIAISTTYPGGKEIFPGDERASS
ncbi:MAG: hypothetical protein LUH22_19325 [Bacteroides sp.]|nr:hypothetical protein [Bacteroides sp.]